MRWPSTFDDLITQAETHDLYLKLVHQLNKDLILANVELTFADEILPSSLRYLLMEQVFILIKENFSTYLNLLYIIDVSEEKVKQLDGSEIAQLSEEVTFLILQREWQKVWFRRTYS